MKKKELIDLKAKELKDLRKFVFDKKNEADKAKMRAGSGKEKNLRIYRNMRRDIAQALTIIREKEIVEKLQK